MCQLDINKTQGFRKSFGLIVERMHSRAAGSSNLFVCRRITSGIPCGDSTNASHENEELILIEATESAVDLPHQLSNHPY